MCLASLTTCFHQPVGGSEMPHKGTAHGMVSLIRVRRCSVALLVALGAALGGLQNFTGWKGPMLTDSGGFQVFSLPGVQINDKGVRFKNENSGDSMELTPERSIQIQNTLGADIIMAFDHCPSEPTDRAEVEDATGRTSRWLSRCVERYEERGGIDHRRR